MTVRVLIADDQSSVRAGLTTILDSGPGIHVFGQAADGREAVGLTRELRPDVCLLDIRMPVLDGIEATRLLAGPEVADPIAVVVITTLDTDDYVYGALKAGARGFLHKGAAPEQLIQAVHAAVRGDALIDPGVTARLLATFSDSAAATVPVHPVEALTEREEKVLFAVARKDECRDRGGAPHQQEHRQVPSRPPQGQARGPGPGRARHPGLRDETRPIGRSAERHTTGWKKL